MESPLLMLATTVAILASIFYVWAKYKLTYWQQRGVPTLPTNLIFGNFKDAMLLRVSPGYLLGRLYNEARGDPPFLGIYIMHKPFLILRDPKIIKQMIIKDFNFFQNRYFSSRNRNDKLGTDNLFSINNPEWKYIRTKLSPTFTSGKLKQLFHLMVETSDNMKNYLDNKFADDKNKIQSIEVKDTSTMYTTDIVASLAFGISTNSFDQPTPEFYKRRFEGDSLVAQSAIFFIAGLESSSVTISFALYELARRPDLQDRVRTEIIDNLNKFGGLTYDSIQNMKYLMQVINETLRLYPPAPIIDRVATEDYKIPDTDIIIEKGTAVYIPLPGVHKNPKYHPDPEKFDPDRFSEERKNDMESCTFLPFGEGPRICIAFRVGMLQTAVGLIRILQGYEVSVNPNYKTEISTRNIFTTPANGIHLYFKKLNV
ncbi:cytochrome P450 6k1-like isoform X2 [Cotesia glomerata]|uniref:cytochrome P450 6k1-like isoform X2 n=1 Tax=Cotesia glomerata TaxID=32391 RepID=UPI001D0146FB|nr:cytochrome P450 6k1-like isoform X2 [Cotesia glomerata]